MAKSAPPAKSGQIGWPNGYPIGHPFGWPVGQPVGLLAGNPFTSRPMFAKACSRRTVPSVLNLRKTSTPALAPPLGNARRDAVRIPSGGGGAKSVKLLKMA